MRRRKDRDGGRTIHQRCPVCGEQDEVVKVPAVAAGRGLTTLEPLARYVHGSPGHWTNVPYSEAEKAAIIESLQTPARPNYSSSPLWISALGALILAALGCIPGVTVFVLVSGYVIREGWTVLYSRSPSYILRSIPIPLAGLLVGGALVAAGYSRYLGGKRRVEGLLPAWQRALQTWSRLYYCRRDDVVFDPRQPGVALEREEVPGYLYHDLA